MVSMFWNVYPLAAVNQLNGWKLTFNYKFNSSYFSHRIWKARTGNRCARESILIDISPCIYKIFYGCKYLEIIFFKIYFDIHTSK